MVDFKWFWPFVGFCVAVGYFFLRGVEYLASRVHVSIGWH